MCLIFMKRREKSYGRSDLIVTFSTLLSLLITYMLSLVLGMFRYLAGNLTKYSISMINRLRWKYMCHIFPFLLESLSREPNKIWNSYLSNHV